MARIKDVAKEANVSIATVSRVINNIPLVNEDTRLKVLAAIEKTGYRPNAVARSLKLQKSNTIGIIINDITRPIMTNAIRGIQEELSKNGYSAIISYTKGEKNAENEALDMFFLRQCDGIILIGTNIDEKTVSVINENKLPVISCLVIHDDKTLPGVGFDEFESSRIVTEYLIENGHSDIGAFMGNSPFHFVPPRIRGFFDVMRKKDLRLNENWIIRNSMTFNGGYECADQLLRLPRNFLPTAIFCFNDDMAVGAIKCFHEHGIKVPDDISVISINGSDFANWNMISITSLKFDSYSCGKRCAEIMYDMVTTGEIPPSVEYIPVHIEEGSTVKNIKK
ncbi:MAG: LacI family DNA-binding transcriptional regulator [Eubacteriaceae bacterium]|nr:LacI family DNA-binding transcriptional regulator [Eubacteriaceae bacterium]